MKELLENAVLSIELGVEDLQSYDERRVASAPAGCVARTSCQMTSTRKRDYVHRARGL